MEHKEIVNIWVKIEAQLPILKRVFMLGRVRFRCLSISSAEGLYTYT